MNLWRVPKHFVSAQSEAFATNFRRKFVSTRQTFSFAAKFGDKPLDESLRRRKNEHQSEYLQRQNKLS